MYKFRLRVHWSLFPWGPVNNSPSLVQIMARSPSGDEPLAESMLVSLLAQICVTWPQWVNGLRYNSYKATRLYHSLKKSVKHPCINSFCGILYKHLTASLAQNATAIAHSVYLLGYFKKHLTFVICVVKAGRKYLFHFYKQKSNRQVSHGMFIDQSKNRSFLKCYPQNN